MPWVFELLVSFNQLSSESIFDNQFTAVDSSLRLFAITDFMTMDFQQDSVVEHFSYSTQVQSSYNHYHV